MLPAVGLLAMIGVLFTMPQFFQAVRGTDAMGSGIHLLNKIGGPFGAAVLGSLLSSATTSEQICEAADVSQSTFFRYFPTKEAVVLSDEYDPLIAEAFRAQPAHLGTVQAIRRAIRSVFEPLSADEIADMRERAVLSMQVPDVWGAALVNLMQTSQLLADLVAERLGTKATDMHIQTFAGAVVGVMMAQLCTWAEHPDIDVAASIDNALAFLQQGLPIDRKNAQGFGDAP